MYNDKAKNKDTRPPVTIYCSGSLYLVFYSIARTCYEKRNKAVQVGEFSKGVNSIATDHRP